MRTIARKSPRSRRAGHVVSHPNAGPTQAARGRGAGGVPTDRIEEHLSEVRLTRISVFDVEAQRKDEENPKRRPEEWEEEREVDRHAIPSRARPAFARTTGGQVSRSLPS